MEGISSCAARAVCGTWRTTGPQEVHRLRLARVALCAPGASSETLEVAAVCATEPSPPENGKALGPVVHRWRSDSGEYAAHPHLVRIVVGANFFAFSRPDSGDRSFDNADDLKRCVAFDAAWRVFDLDRLAREKPDTPAFEVLSCDDALYLLLLDQRIKRPPKPPDIQTAVIARLVGFRPTKRQLLPGNEKLWNGYVKLKHSSAMYRAIKNTELNVGG